MKSKLVLWDIDGTLLDDGGIAQEAFSVVIRDILGSGSVITIETSGKTDLKIISELLITNGLPKEALTNDLINDTLENYFRYYCAKTKQFMGRLYPGIKEILEVLDKSEVTFQGLVTGNIKKLAYFKLSRFGIARYFKVGGFGDDSYYRQKIAKRAIERANKAFNKNFQDSDIYIVGDTVFDIKCGKVLNAITVGVATGSTAAINLKRAGADYVFQDLSEYAYCLRALKLV